MRTLGTVLCLAILIAIIEPGVGPGSVHAQSGGSLLTIYAEPPMVKPGQWLSLDVVASGVGRYAAIAIDVPSQLLISDEVTCVHSSYYCDGWTISPLDANTNRLTATAPGNSVGSPSNWPTGGYSSSVRVTLSFSALVPNNAVPGTRFEIDAFVDGLFNLYDPDDEAGKRVSIVVEVLDAAGQRVAPSTAPVATSEPTASTASGPTLATEGRPSAPTNTGQIMVFPQMVETSPGQTVEFDLSLSRSATLDLARIAVYVWAESGTITNFPPEQIDDDGLSACTEGETGDEMPALERAYEVGRDTPLPTSIMVTIDDDVPPARELLVCVEMIGFDHQGMTLFSWNAPGIIKL